MFNSRILLYYNQFISVKSKQPTRCLLSLLTHTELCIYIEIHGELYSTETSRFILPSWSAKYCTIQKWCI